MHTQAPILLIAAAILAGTSQAAMLTKSLQAFSTIKVCTPFNVLIQPSSGHGQYQVALDADSAVEQALQASVTGNVLSLGASGQFKTSNPIKLTVRWIFLWLCVISWQARARLVEACSCWLIAFWQGAWPACMRSHPC